MNEILWTAIGSLVTGAGLVFSLLKFYTERRDKDHLEEKEKFYSEFFSFQDRLEKEFQGTRLKLDSAISDLVSLRLTVEIQKEKFASLTEKFTEYTQELRRILEKHDVAIEKFGRVIKLRSTEK